MFVFVKNEKQEQSHYIEVAQGDIFMEQNMRFGLILGRLAILKKKDGGADCEQLLRAVFSCFQGQKNSYFFFKNTLASALKIIRETSLRDLYIMTLDETTY